MPVSAKQLDANRANAKKSTGPKSLAGRKASSANATSHGLHSRRFLIEPGQEHSFSDLQQTLRAEVLPLGALETDAFQQLLHAAWQLRRSDALEASLHSPAGPAESQLALLERLARLRASLERSYQRAWRRLRELQNIRAAEQKLPNPEALVHAALTPLAIPPKPAPPLDPAMAKRSHFEPSTRIYELVESQIAAGITPEFPLRALIRIHYQLNKPEKTAA